nr:U-box domain-containing protein 12-like isoform X1 [Ipomoea batatas]
MGWKYQAGLVVIAIFVFIWVASAETTPKIFLEYKQPFAITYLGISLMVIYLPIALCKDWISRLLGMNSFKKLHSDNNPLLDSSILYVPLRMNDIEQNVEENLGSYSEKDTNLEEGNPVMRKIQDNKCQGLSKLEVIRCSLYLAPLWFVTEYLSNSALANTSVASTTVLTSTSALFTLFFGAMLGQDSINTAKFIAVALSMNGVAMTTVGKTWASDEILSVSEERRHCIIGDAYGLLSAASYGLFTGKALSVIWTTPLVATLGISLTIPSAMLADMVVHGRSYSLVYILGCIQVFVGFVMANLHNKPSTEECLAEAAWDAEENQHKALQNLVAITKVSPQNRNLVAQAEGAIPRLLGLSKSSSSSITVRVLALSTLFNLSLNPNLKKSLADMESITFLNSLILSQVSEESCKIAASVVCSLAMLDKNKAKFGVAGSIEALTEAISRPRCQASHHLLSSLAELVQFQGNCTVAVRSGAIPVLLKLVESADNEDLSGTSLAILSLLARFDEGLGALKKTDQIVASMLEILKGRCMLSKEGAAEILVRLFDESEGCIRDALRLPEFSFVLADLSVRGSGRTREKASSLMKKLMEANQNDAYPDDDVYFQW